MTGLRRACQLACLAAFLALLGAAFFGLTAAWPTDLFLRMDPLIFLGTVVLGRVMLAAFIPAMVVLAAGPLLGRAFCGWVCPMGTSLNGPDALIRRTGAPPGPGWKRIKYWLLALVIGAALAGLSVVFLFSPLSLITRLYGLFTYPALALGLESGLAVIHPLASELGLTRLAMAGIRTPVFATTWFIILFFAGLIIAARHAPRLWCRYLCPAVALIALTSFRPLIRRRVNDDCADCGRCAQKCPMAAIGSHPRTTDHTECLVCHTCAGVCPEKAITFRPGVALETAAAFSPDRRTFVRGGLSGVAMGVVNLTGLASPRLRPGVGRVRPPGLIRPPGSLPELDFLARCVGCGACAVACPTNTLQPLWLAAGWEGLFSPALLARRGPCDPHCHACAPACPTRAIRPVSREERVAVKTGTAVIDRSRCLAWEQNRKCMVCGEVCPYGAIDFETRPGQPVAVPHVRENRCAGCGYCEHYCPVQNRSAINIIALGEMRLERGSYIAAGVGQGLELRLKPEQGYGGAATGERGGEGETAPGFTD